MGSPRMSNERLKQNLEIRKVIFRQAFADLIVAYEGYMAQLEKELEQKTKKKNKRDGQKK